MWGVALSKDIIICTKSLIVVDFTDSSNIPGSLDTCDGGDDVVLDSDPCL